MTIIKILIDLILLNLKSFRLNIYWLIWLGLFLALFCGLNQHKSTRDITLENKTVKCGFLGARNEIKAGYGSVFIYIYDCEGIRIEQNTKYFSEKFIFNKRVFIHQNIFYSELKTDYVFLNRIR